MRKLTFATATALTLVTTTPAFAEGGWSMQDLRDNARGSDGRNSGGCCDCCARPEDAPSPYFFEGASNHNPNTASATVGNGSGVGGMATSGGSVGKGSIR